MKKRFLSLALAGCFLMGLASCSTCVTCDCFGDSDEICESDFDSKDQYNASVDLLEALGCSCS
ncbi:hypothetical protein N9C06_07085 [Salibacteraceae bacterium]|nr:hypothetical protein [Salibacteraceae bacterium]